MKLQQIATDSVKRRVGNVALAQARQARRSGQHYKSDARCAQWHRLQ